MSRASALTAGQASIAFRKQSQVVLLIRQKNGMVVMNEDSLSSHLAPECVYGVAAAPGGCQSVTGAGVSLGVQIPEVWELLKRLL